MNAGMTVRKRPSSKTKTAKTPKKPRAAPPYFNQLVYDVWDAAASLGVSYATVNRLIYAVPPQLRSMKIGSRRCVPVSAINEYIERQMQVESQKYSGGLRGRSS